MRGCWWDELATVSGALRRRWLLRCFAISRRRQLLVVNVQAAVGWQAMCIPISEN
jgi:hypothetical protein